MHGARFACARKRYTQLHPSFFGLLCLKGRCAGVRIATCTISVTQNNPVPQEYSAFITQQQNAPQTEATGTRWGVSVSVPKGGLFAVCVASVPGQKVWCREASSRLCNKKDGGKAVHTTASLGRLNDRALDRSNCARAAMYRTANRVEGGRQCRGGRRNRQW